MPFDFNGEGSVDGRGSNISQNDSSHGFQNKGSMSAKGFKNTPERKSSKSDSHSDAFQTLSTPMRTVDTYSRRTRRTRLRRPFPRREIMIPWKMILMIVGIFILVAILWVNRDVISAFLSQVLSWVITILVIIFLVKTFILRR